MIDRKLSRICQAWKCCNETPVWCMDTKTQKKRVQTSGRFRHSPSHTSEDDRHAAYQDVFAEHWVSRVAPIREISSIQSKKEVMQIKCKKKFLLLIHP
jgi:hypothetical protein